VYPVPPVPNVKIDKGLVAIGAGYGV